MQAHIGSGSELLDVGCGDGVLTKSLIDAGYRVTAIDSSEKATAEAEKRGVKVLQADFLQHDFDRKFDAVFFSRSMHHIQPIRVAVEKTWEVLKPNGLILLEDFGPELFDMKTAVWFYGLRAVIEAERPMTGRGPQLENGQMPADPLAAWHDYYLNKHNLNKSSDVIESLRSKFTCMEEYKLPYLYRYFGDDVTSAQLQKILDWETALCKVNAIQPIGVRFVGKK